MEKLLRVLMLLSGIRSYTLKEIAEHFNIGERTVYRYLNAIESAGFVLDKREGRYRLALDDTATKTLDKLFHFTEEEAYVLYKTLTQIEGSEAIATRLIRKLHTLYDLKTLARLQKNNEMERVQVLAAAIKDKKQVLLQQYRSSNSDAITDRNVEPFQFMEDYKAVWCFDTDDKANKQFKLARMNSVSLLSAHWFYEDRHKVPFTDAFRMSAAQPLATVEAMLTLKANNLLLEEYSLTAQYIRKEQRRYHLKIPIAEFQGIGRFVMGLPGEVEVLEPEEFKEFLRRKRKISFD